MRALTKSIHRLIRDSKAATAIEYGLICALIVLAIMAALLALGTVTTDMWDNVSTKVQTAG
ncbi:Flp family type IVb pilin [Sphingomonas sp. Root241]|jgi:pilus assembly protein Flp/PilA|uniref:Flp family type IVb pilin n=1 Tax=Sphingomonas sp. Root241 TaxID=1736501 RepID=UPI0006FB48B9|nr:Flp family type IVb pilin [Sphingomonas sp. Root241]KRC78177.1 pilus assembly protein [Sphingomonas sp. Root241]